MLANRMLALACIFTLAAAAWMYLGRTIVARTQQTYTNINSRVEGLCGAPITQRSPVVTDAENAPLDLRSSVVTADLELEYRRKGLLWFPVYTVDFDGTYTVRNNAAKARPLTVRVPFPAEKGSLDNFAFTVNGNGDWETGPDHARITVPVDAGQTATIAVQCKTRGLRTWRYAFDESVQHVRDFALTVTTDTPAIDFPADTIAPTRREARSFTWEYRNRLSGFQIGIAMPERLNPGDVAARIAFFA
ncbi:MAG TPA: hypothetical protein PLZ36_11940, partial [Armatimonadota bacterium]|nr:hypothetical protein [Armatimonadota bacterium]